MEKVAQAVLASPALKDLSDKGLTRFKQAMATQVLVVPALQRTPSEIRARFRQAVRSVILMCRFCRYFMACSKYRISVPQFTFLDCISHHPAGGVGKNLVFDVNHFKVKENRIPLRLVYTMRMPPELRSGEDVLLLHNMLCSVEIFRRYSNTLQFLLARVVRYQRLERRRVVIKKGDAGHSFYFVFSGQLAVTKDKDGSSAFADKEPIIIRKGMSFGDVALIKGVRRNATVVCMEETELMVIDKEDFFAYEMDVELNREFEFRFNFFRSLQLFSSWSDSLCEQMADHSKVEPLLYGCLVVKDTNDMNNIIFVAKGQCDIMRVVDLTSFSAYQRLLKQQHDTGAQESGVKVVSPRRQHGNQDGKQAEQQCSLTKLRHLIPPRPTGPDLPTSACFLIDSLHHGSTFGLHEYLLPQRQRDGRQFSLVSRSVEVLRVDKMRFDELVDPATLGKMEALQKTYPSDEELCTVFVEHIRWRDFKQCVVRDLLTDHFARDSTFGRGRRPPNPRHAAANRGRPEPRPGATGAARPEAPRQDTQGTGDQTQLIIQGLRDGRQFSLVSRSVEALRVDKMRFDELVDPATLGKMEALQKTYPSDEELCTVFVEHIRWRDFKQCVVRDLLTDHFARDSTFGRGRRPPNPRHAAANQGRPEPRPGATGAARPEAPRQDTQGTGSGEGKRER